MPLSFKFWTQDRSFFSSASPWWMAQFEEIVFRSTILVGKKTLSLVSYVSFMPRPWRCAFDHMRLGVKWIEQATLSGIETTGKMKGIAKLMCYSCEKGPSPSLFNFLVVLKIPILISTITFTTIPEYIILNFLTDFLWHQSE